MIKKMEQLYLSNEIFEKLFPQSLTDRRIFFTDKILINNTIVEKDSLTTGSFSKALPYDEIFFTEKLYNFVSHRILNLNLALYLSPPE